MVGVYSQSTAAASGNSVGGYFFASNGGPDRLLGLGHHFSHAGDCGCVAGFDGRQADSRQTTVWDAADVSSSSDAADVSSSSSDAAVKLQGRIETRRHAMRLHDRLCKLIDYDARERACHHVSAKKSSISVVVNNSGRARFRGVYRCGNVWACPLCAPIIAAKRAEQVDSVLRWGVSEGFCFSKHTFTCSHSRSDSLLDLLVRQSQAMKFFKTCRAVRKLRKDMGFVDSMSAREVTWSSRNGWHPHQHEYWMYNKLPTEVQFRQLEILWIHALAKFGLLGGQGVALHSANMTDAEISCGVASSYLSKSGTAVLTGAGYELSGGVIKSGSKKSSLKSSHYTPLELLDKGKGWANKLFMEFFDAYRFRKQLIFGRKILKAYKDLFGTCPGNDGQVVDKSNEIGVDEVEVMKIEPGRMAALRYAGRSVELLELIEVGELEAAQRVVDESWELYSNRYADRLRYRIRGCGVSASVF